MSRFLCCAACVAGLFATVNAAEVSPSVDARSLAHRTWLITDVVLAKHVEPPSRGAMLLAGFQAMLTGGQGPVPGVPRLPRDRTKSEQQPAILSQSPVLDDLRSRIEQTKNEQQLAILLQQLWPHSLPRDEVPKVFVNSLLRSVPGQPALLSAETVRLQRQTSANRYIGIGIQIRRSTTEDFCQVVVPSIYGPARRAGVRAKDLIIEVDGMSMKGQSLVQLVHKLRGEEGTTVTLTVRQTGATEARTYKIVRSVVPFDNVVGYRRTSEEGWDYRVEPSLPVAYVRLTAITSSTAHELRNVEHRILAAGLRAVVLDLRFCADGNLHHTRQVADELLDAGVFWRVVDGRGHAQEYHANRDCVFRDLPLVVVLRDASFGRDPRHLDGDTLSLLASVLQEHRHAVLIGEARECQAWATSVVDMPDGLGAVYLRTGAVERSPQPGKRSVRLQPQHLVKLERKALEALYEWHHTLDVSPASAAQAKPPDDPQLAKAMEVLRDLLAKPGK